jgi:multiple sugar transport system permease protein
MAATRSLERSTARGGAGSIRRPALPERAKPYLYLAPALLSIFVWTYWPILGTIELSFYQWNLLPSSPKTFTGLENYAAIFALPELVKALGNTLIYIVGLLPFSVAVPLIVALAVNDMPGRWRGFYQSIVFLPVLMAPVVVGIIWGWILSPSQGILHEWLHAAFGLGQINWFRDGATALAAIMVITGWKLLGFSVLLLTAGLTNISRDYVEAAAIDGADRRQIVWFITLPLLSPTVMFLLLMTVLFSSQWTFPLINLLTQGGPLDATTNVYYVLWHFAFQNFNVGISSAAAVMFFSVFIVIALALVRLIDRFSFFDS